MPGGEELSEILFSNMKLDELESKLSFGDSSKESVMGTIDEAQGSILPIRLKFNDFLQTMSSIDKMSEVAPDEKFFLIRSKLMELTKSLQQVSEEFAKLQPLFDTVPEYAERYGNKRYMPLETLRSASSINGNGFSTQQQDQPYLQQQQQSQQQQSQQTQPQPQQPSLEMQQAQQVQPQFQHQQSSNGNPASTFSAIQSRKSSKSNAATPGSNVNTPSGGITMNNVTPSSKKPRKPRQPKKSASGINMGNMGMGSVPTPVMSSSNFKPQNVQSPSVGGASVMNSAPNSNSNGNGISVGNSVQTVNSVPPTNTMNTPMNNVMSPLGNVSSGFGLSQSHPPQPLPQQMSQQMSQQLTQQRQQQAQQQRQQQVQAQAHAQQQQQQQQHHHQQQHHYNMGPRSGQLPQAQINMNTITPANILSMNMAADNQQNLGSRAGKDFDPLDINNLDFGNLNMDFI